MSQLKLSAIAFVCLFFGLMMQSGCELLLNILQRDMAEEKKIFGSTSGYNEKVEKLQIMLEKLGYNPGPRDGKLGNKTRQAIESFQKAHQLKATGYAGKKTVMRLKIIYEAKFLHTHVSCEVIQSALKRAGFDPGPVDGKMGPKTKRAIKAFQKDHGLIVDGKVGPATWNELKTYTSKPIQNNG